MNGDFFPILITFAISHTGGMRAGCSFSLLEVIVGCEVEDKKVSSEGMDNDLVVARNRCEHSNQAYILLQVTI